MGKGQLLGIPNWLLERITKINSDLEWKLLGNTTGTNSLALPDDYKELKVLVAIEENIEYAHSIHITRKEVDDGTHNFYNGFFFLDTSNGGVRVGVHDNNIAVITLYSAKVDMKDKAKMRVYYR